MITRRGLVVLTAAFVLVAMVATMASAQEDVTVDTDFSGGEIGAGITGTGGGRPGGGGSGGSGSGGGGGANASPYEITLTRLAGPCQLEPERPGVVRYLYEVRTVNRLTGEAQNRQQRCIAEDEPPPPPPPPAPTYAELRARAPIPPPRISVSPSASGLTGLATVMEYTGSTTPQSVDVSLRGWTAVVRAQAMSIRWTITGPSAGSYLGATATHVFERVGTYTITMSITWAADADVAGYGVGREVDLGVRTTSVTRTYPVKQLRSATR